MGFQIDQSIKIENTQKASFVCLANGQILVGSISARDKRILKLFFREVDKPLIFKLFTFAYLCAKLIIKAKIDSVTIDQEYSGHGREIKSFIIQIIQIEGMPEPAINFAEIGKSSPAHKYGYIAFKQKRADLKVTSQEILRYYEKINKR